MMVCLIVVQDMEDYLKGCRFLPKLNNEIPSARNTTYKERFSSLENLVLIMVSLNLSNVACCFNTFWVLIFHSIVCAELAITA
jgi:hypothetical protein